MDFLLDFHYLEFPAECIFYTFTLQDICENQLSYHVEISGVSFLVLVIKKKKKIVNDFVMNGFEALIIGYFLVIHREVFGVLGSGILLRE